MKAVLARCVCGGGGGGGGVKVSEWWGGGGGGVKFSEWPVLRETDLCPE